MIRFAPGTFLWLLRHEMRLARRSLPGLGIIGLILVVLAAPLHIVGYEMGKSRVSAPGFDDMTVLALLGLIGLVLFGFAFASTAAILLESLYFRRDYDLLLTSPVRREPLLMARLLGVAVSAFWLNALIVLPLVNGAAIAGAPHFLAAYATVPAGALLATTLSLLLVVTLVRTLGIRRARTLGQVLAALLGLVVAATPQVLIHLDRLGSKASERVEPAERQPLHRAAAFVAMGRIASGEPVPVAAFTLLGMGGFVLATRTLGRRWFDDMVSGRGMGSERRTRRGDGPLILSGGGVTAAMWRKEWRVVTRDPVLIARVARQALPSGAMAIPLLGEMTDGPAPVSLAWTVVVLLAGLLAMTLSHLAHANEQAPDLVGAAPVTKDQLDRARWQVAGILPVGFVVVACMALAVSGGAWAVPALLLCGIPASLSIAATIVHLLPPPRRYDRGQVPEVPLLPSLGCFFLAFCWCGVAMLGLTFGWLPFLAGYAAMLFVTALASPLTPRRRA